MIRQRLDELMDEHNLTWQQLAIKSDIPIETMRNIYYGKVTDPKVSTMLRLSKVLNCSINYLCGDKCSNRDEENILYYYRKCGKHGKSILEQIGRFEAHLARAEHDNDVTHSIPCFAPDSSACEGAYLNATDIDSIITKDPRAYMALRVPNNNWAPKYCTDDIILFENRFPKHGEQGLFYENKRLFYRNYIEENKTYILRCINNRHEDLIFKRMDAFDCLGTAIGVIRA